MSRNKLIINNSIFLITRIIFSLLISFYTTRVILKELGASDYGVFSVVYGIVTFFTFIVNAMNDSVQRYASIAIGKGDSREIKNVALNSIFIYLSYALIFIIVLFSLKKYILFDFLNIPKKSWLVAEQLYIMALASIFLNIIQTPFNAFVLAFEKMSFFAYMTIFDALSKLLISVFIVLIPYDKLATYSMLLLISSLISFIIYVIYCISKFHDSFTGGRLSRTLIYELSSFSLWNVFGNFAYACRTQGINIAINIFFSITVNAAYSLSTTLLYALNSLAQSLVTALKPQIFKTYAESNTDRYNSLIYFGSKYTFILLFTLSCPVLLNTQGILALWLVNIPPYTIWLVRFMVVVALIDSFSSSIITGIQATGKIKVYQVVVGIIMFLSLPLTYILFKLNFSVYTAFLPLISLSLLNLFVRTYFLSCNTCFNFVSYYKVVVIRCVVPAFFSVLIGYILGYGFTNNSLLCVMFLGTIHSLICLLLFYIFTVSKVEKKWIVTHFLRRKNDLRNYC